jgi:FMN phosphatase YigB (HAD superfamily)
VANGVPRLPQLYQEYKASLADRIQKQHEVRWWIIEFRLRIVDIVQFASRTNKWAEEIYNHCYDEYSNLYQHLAERCGACPR